MEINIKNQKGAISLFVLLSMMFFLAFMLGAFTLVNQRNISQVESLSETQKIYENKPSASDLYDSIFANESSVVPIINVKQLKSAIEVNDTNTQIKYLINGKVYTYKKEANYILQKDIVIDYSDVKGNIASFTFDNFKSFLEKCTKLEDTYNINLNYFNVYYRNRDNKLCKLDGKLAYFIENKSNNFENNINVISKYNLGEYLGKEIKNYTPNNSDPTTHTAQFTYTANSTTYTYITSSVYRLFYIDFDNKYGDNSAEATIYLKADYTNNYYDLQLINNNDLPEGNKLLQLNTLWKEKIDNGSYSIGTIFKDSENKIKNKNKVTAWLLDPSVWDDLRYNILDSKINYVIGAPTIEMYIDSYNTYLETHPDTLNADGNQARQLACEYVKENDQGDHGHQNHETEGYIIGFKEDSQWDYWDYTTYPTTSSYYANYYSLQGNGGGLNKNDLVSSSVCNGMYNPGKQNNSRRNAWIASPSSSWFAHNGIQNEKYKRVMSILGEDNDNNAGNQSRISNEWYTFSGNSTLTFSPIVSIKYDSQLAFSE